MSAKNWPTTAVSIGVELRNEIEFLRTSSISTLSKAQSISTSVTKACDLRSYDNTGQLDQKTVDLEYILSIIFESLLK